MRFNDLLSDAARAELRGCIPFVEPIPGDDNAARRVSVRLPDNRLVPLAICDNTITAHLVIHACMNLVGALTDDDH